MKTVDGNTLQLLLFTLPLICEPLTNQPTAFCKSEYDHLTCLKLADSCDTEDMAIDILIGSEAGSCLREARVGIIWTYWTSRSPRFLGQHHH